MLIPEQTLLSMSLRSPCLLNIECIFYNEETFRFSLGSSFRFLSIFSSSFRKELPQSSSFHGFQQYLPIFSALKQRLYCSSWYTISPI